MEEIVLSTVIRGALIGFKNFLTISEKPAHEQIPSVSFLNTTTMGEVHSAEYTLSKIPLAKSI